MWEQLNAPVPAAEAGARRGRAGRRGRTTSRASSSKASISSRASPTRRWATARAGSTSARPLPRARGRDGGAARSAFPRRRDRRRRAPARVTSSGWACCARARRSRRTAAHYTADLRPERIAEFLLLNAEFPRSVRFAAARVESALRAIAQLTGRGAGGRAERLAGRLHASLDYGQVDEILSDDPHAYLEGIGRQCAQIHAARLPELHQRIPIESALPA